MDIQKAILGILSCFALFLAGCSHHAGPVAARAPAQYCAEQVYTIHGDPNASARAGERHRPLKVVLSAQNYRNAKCAVYAR